MLARPLLAVLLAGATALSLSSAGMANERPQVLATIAMIGDVAAEVVGDCAEVGVLMGAGVDPHLYQASARDVRRFQDADVILYSGYALEGQLGDVLERLGQTKPTIAMSPTSIPPEHLITTADVYGVDPHLWMDASLWSKLAPTVATTVGEVTTDCAAAMNARAETFIAQTTALHGWITEAVASIPRGQRVMVTAHDAFEYYGRAYGIEVLGIQGISTESEAGIADIREMVDVVVERDVPAVFIESTINPRTIEAVIEAAAERGHKLVIGGELFSDAMGEPGTAEGTYIGMLVANTTTVVKALGGTLPPLPEALTPWAERWGHAQG